MTRKLFRYPQLILVSIIALLLALVSWGLIATPVYANGEYHSEYDLPEDDNILPGWGGWIDRSIHAWAESEEYPEGRDYDLQVTNVSIESQNPQGGVIELREEGDGWDYWATGFGNATVRLDYEDIDGSAKSHRFNVNVSDTVYRVDMWSPSGVYQGLPGSSLELQANAVKSEAMQDENDPNNWWNEDTSEGLQYSWSITEGKDYATIKADISDPSRAVLSFKALPAGRDYIDERVEVKVSVKDAGSDKPNEIRAERWSGIWVADEFYQIEPATIDSDLDIGKTLTIKPELRFYQLGQSGYKVINNVKFEICNYDDNAIAVKGLTITRKREWDTNFCLRAEWDDHGRQADIEQWYHLNRRNYRIDFKHGHMDLYEDQDTNVELEKEDLDNVNYKVTYTVGRWNDQEDKWDKVLPKSSYKVTDDGIVISGKAVKDAKLDGVNVHAELTVNGMDFGDTWTWLELRYTCPKGNHKWIKATIKEATVEEEGMEVWICLAHYLWDGCGQVRFVKTDKKIDIAKAKIGSIKAVTYNGKALEPALTVKYGSALLKKDTDYDVYYAGNINAGTATVTVVGRGKYAGNISSNFKINQAANPIKLTPKKATVKFNALKKKNQIVKQKAACVVKDAKGKVSWKKVSGNAKITVAANGNITVKKGLKKGTYKIKVKATAAGDKKNYKKGEKAAFVSIIVK